MEEGQPQTEHPQLERKPSPVFGNRLEVFFAQADSLASPDSPPPRPGSALSGSGSSFVNRSDDGDSDEDLNAPYTRIQPRAVASTSARDNSRCLLCDSSVDVCALRLTGVDDGESEIGYLRLLCLVPDHFHMDHFSNLMTLCMPHAYAYLSYVWRFVLCKEDRKAMLTHEEDDRRRRMESQPGLHSKRTIPELSGHFDLAVFLPDQMPQFTSSRDDTNPPQGRGISSLSLPLNSFMAFVSTLRIANSCYWPPPDLYLSDIETDLMKLRATYNNYHRVGDVYVP